MMILIGRAVRLAQHQLVRLQLVLVLRLLQYRLVHYLVVMVAVVVGVIGNLFRGRQIDATGLGRLHRPNVTQIERARLIEYAQLV